jgi:hypothetical protein
MAHLQSRVLPGYGYSDAQRRQSEKTLARPSLTGVNALRRAAINAINTSAILELMDVSPRRRQVRMHRNAGRPSSSPKGAAGGVI